MPKILNQKTGFTLIEVLVGSFLILVVFLGIIGAYRLGVKVVGLSKNKVIATAIANGQIEKIRNLSYASVGTIGADLPYAAGVLDSSTTTTRNGVEFTIATQVKYIADEADGGEGTDGCNRDYKRAEVKVSWSGLFGGEVKLATDAAPKNLTEELNSCTIQPGGLLSIQVFDALGAMVNSAFVEVFNPSTGEKITDIYTPASGKVDIALATSTKKVVISKTGYSGESTYASGDIHNGKTIITPEKPHPIVLENQQTQTSFQIDKVSSFSVDTLSTWGTDSFSDSFSDESKISATSSVVIIGGEVNLASTTETGYASSGYVVSQTITPLNLDKWSEFSWSDFEDPATTTAKYQVLYYDGLGWTLIPEADLAGNGAGFTDSPVDLINLATTTYPELRLKANLETTDASSTPAVYSWQVFWRSANATPIGGVTFNLQGAKSVGLDSADQPIYKYSENHTTNSSGHKDISNLEWDSYTFSVAPETGLDLVGIDPSPQPVNLSPNANIAVKLYLDAQNSLLVTVQNSVTLEPVFGATVRLYKTGYDKTQYTDEKGQTLFIPLAVADYSLEVQASPAYSPYSGSVSVSGDNTKTISLAQVE
jgi:hypothetical protein